MSLSPILFLLVACLPEAKIRPSDGSKAFYKSLSFSVDSTLYSGLSVLPPKLSYDFRLEFERSIALLRVSNCHRDQVFRDISKRKYLYSFSPNPLVENGSCILQFTALSANGKHKFGAVTFKRKDENIDAILSCNGSRKAYRGASVCQGKIGTIQAIEIHAITVKSSCDLPVETPGDAWVFTMQDKYCIYLFKHDDEYHKLTTFGYSEHL